jgi:hypothetical protein
MILDLFRKELELSILFFYPHMPLQNTCINLKRGDCRCCNQQTPIHDSLLLCRLITVAMIDK